jgi:hypothetical protein
MKAKKIFISTSVACFLIAIASFTFYSCKKKPFDDIAQIANVNFTTATIGVQFVDATTGENVGFKDASQNVNLSIIGPNADKIVTVANDNDFKSVLGFLNLALKEGVTATKTNPVQFTITASAKGYITTSFPITVSESGGIGVKINMVAITNAPAGVGVMVDNTSLDATQAGSSTGTSTTISMSTPIATKGSDQTTATIDIPVGQKFYTDASHSERVTEAIEVTFATFSATEGASLMAFPGSLQARLANNTTGQFITAGLVTIEMKTASGKEITSFEKPIQVTTGVPSGILKPDGSAMVAGDTIPVWSHSNATGMWTYEGNATITDNGGKLETTYSISHLSYWNTDMLSDYCYQGATLNFTGNISSDVYYQALMVDQNDTYIADSDINCKAGTSDQMSGGANRNIRIYIYKNYSDYYSELSGVKSKYIGKSALFNGCSGNTTINVINPDLIPPTINATITATCSGSNKKYRPTLPIFTMDITAGETTIQFIGSMIEGKFSSNKLIIGHTYRTFSMIKNTVAFQDVTITGTEMEVDLDLGEAACAALKVR